MNYQPALTNYLILNDFLFIELYIYDFYWIKRIISNGIIIANNFAILGEKLQLVDIIQLVLVGFVGISAIIFLFSYLGFRRREKQFNPKIQIIAKAKSEKIEKVKVQADKTEKIPVVTVEEEEIEKKQIVQPEVEKNKQVRFEVFKPNKEKEHFPKILKVNSPKNDKS